MNKGDRVKTPKGVGTIAYVRMAPPTYHANAFSTHDVAAVSVVLDLRRTDERYTGTIFAAGDVELIRCYCGEPATHKATLGGLRDDVCEGCKASLRESTLEAQRATVDAIVERMVKLTDIAPSTARECANNAVCAVDVEPPYNYGIASALFDAIEHRVRLSRVDGADPTWRLVLDRVVRRNPDLASGLRHAVSVRNAAIGWIVDHVTKGLEP